MLVEPARAGPVGAVMSRPDEGLYEAPDVPYLDELADAAADAYERQYTRDGTPYARLGLALCETEHEWQPCIPGLEECSVCGSVRDA